ncbi:hypothetical protein CJ206_08490 [Dolosicoccus paucivorans]|uniref:lysylphosphatidylglycerol synthase transmembrane domain-containing protein n=1 Tax=Dolosicoccus paucivorans TaxID=84521 RepID=UPI000C804F8B|nr:lysylphosphatidylglycerol synthase transmembrane domain-containing protein [Dolosicoccus paucivorans]PMB83578.1 hypothetical protein CJ206_08490 [Dolosicoccus paucivorans]
MKILKQHQLAINFSLLIILSAGMSYLIYKGSGATNVLSLLASMDRRFLLLAVVFFIMFRLMEGLSFYYLFKSMPMTVSLFNCIKYSMMGYFFSQVTPSGGGGQPAQFYLMKQDGIPLSKAVSVIVPFNLIYHMSFSFFDLLALLSPLRQIILSSQVRVFFYIGLAIQLFLSLVTMLAIKKTSTLSQGLIYLSEKTKHWPLIRRFYQTPERIEASVQTTKANLMTVIKSKRNIVSMLVLQTVMLFFYYGIAYCSYRALGFNNYRLLDIIAIQCLITVATEYMPTPGTAGFAELSMYAIYQKLVPTQVAVSWMLVNRLLMLYLAMGVTLLMIRRRQLNVAELSKQFNNF